MSNLGTNGRKKRWILPFVILLVAIVIAFFMASMRKPPPHKVVEETAALVNVQPLQTEAIQLQVLSRGVVQPRYSTELVAQVSGEINSIAEAFVRGGIVKKGQLLAQIDPTNYQVRLEESRAGLASATAALELEQAQGEVARVEWQGVSDHPAPALGLRKPQLKQAQAQVAAAKAALKQAQKDLDRTQIIAPYDALVAARNVSLGTFVNVGTMMGQVLDISSAEIRLPVANGELQYLLGDGVGSQVELSGDAMGTDTRWQAKIVRTEGVIDDDTRMSYLVARVNDPYNLKGESLDVEQADLVFGSFVVANIVGRNLSDAVRIPRNLIKDGAVPVYNEGKLQLKPVTVLRHIGGESVVTDGIADGDLLVTTSLEYPVAGMALKRFDERAAEVKSASSAASGQALSAAKRDQGEQ
ncbi:efflux RND transporter periplasmic adaptor subunit [Gilvimarinus polysaccharolyticus]|uniref:efflux RND transporter periplasmic adaptor subunit n=1 Tax=Gilvimarinus polysaccharolyticus TaxID=863921 RepID=UPI000673743E|nr:efflux RND transporter periplasmic adaptor subunit [Gilvimarinus polysaccharolyticus]